MNIIKMMHNVMKLYFSYYSPPARSVYMIVKALNLNVQVENVDILTKKYLLHDLTKINPQHTIPTLVDGKFILWDSHAIALYLVSKFQNKNLYPWNIKKRAIIHQRLFFDTEQLFPQVYEIAYPLLFRGKTNVPNILNENVLNSYGILEKFLERTSWIAGNDLTVADLCCISSISTLDYLVPINKKKYPSLMRYVQQCRELPYYREANQIGLDMLGTKIQERLIHAYVRSLTIKSSILE